MTESTTMENPERQPDQRESQKIPEGQLFESIAKKMETEIARFSLAGNATVLFSETVKTVGKAIPFAYKPAKRLQELVAADFLKQYGYEYDVDEIIYAAFRILEAKRAFMPEEEEFVANNYVAIKRLILERSKLKGEKKESQKEGDNVAEIYESAKELVKKVLKQKRSKEKKNEASPISVDAANEFDLLNLDVFNLAELGGTDPEKFDEIFQGASSLYPTKIQKVEHYRRIFGIDRGVEDEVIEKTFGPAQEAFLRRTNQLWGQILKMFHEKEGNIEKAKFKGRVKDSKSIFDLYKILDRLRYGVNLKEEDLEEIDQARVKLVLYMRAAKIRLSPRYKLRHSIKAYMDEYLERNVFEITGKEKIPVPVVSQVDITKTSALEVEVLTARLVDPDGEDVVEVYIYQGGDAGHPETPKSGIVNMKSLPKMVLKSLNEKMDPEDLFRITVMPKTERPEDLRRVREILSKTILHPQSLNTGSSDTRDNKASAYGGRDIGSRTSTIVPSILYRGRLKRGCVRDVKKGGSLAPLSSFKLEVRTGSPRSVISEHHPFDDTNHGVYRRIRMLPTFNLLRNPKKYQGNWMGRAVQTFDSISERLEQTSSDTLPIWVRLKCMQTYLSVLEHDRRRRSSDV